MVSVGRSNPWAAIAVGIIVLVSSCPAFAVDDYPAMIAANHTTGAPAGIRSHSMPHRKTPSAAARWMLPAAAAGDMYVKVAYGRTFGASTELDYTTVEVSKGLKKYPASTKYGPALGELQLALLASHVDYHGGHVERLKRLAYADGYELGLIPKAHVTLPEGPLGFRAYLESGAGIGYVSETYRNSGSRWNWSLLGGFGFERNLKGWMDVSLGLQWRHLSNANMWGKGDELHNSNSGTDMIQGLARVLHRF